MSLQEPIDKGPKIDRRSLTWIKPGEVRNPLGRPKGSRTRLAEAMVADFCESWDQHGKQAIETLRKKRPVDYVRIASQLIPKEYLVRDDTMNGMSDDQLGAVIDRMKQIIAQHDENMVDITPVETKDDTLKE